MNATYNITEKTGYTHARISSFEGARTFQDNRFRLDKAAVVAEANSIIRDAHIRLPEIGDDYSDEGEITGMPSSPNLVCKPNWNDLPKKQSDNLQREKLKKAALRLSEKRANEGV